MTKKSIGIGTAEAVPSAFVLANERQPKIDDRWFEPTTMVALAEG
jgi:hypothetical protein